MSPQAHLFLTRRAACGGLLSGTAMLAGCDLVAPDDQSPASPSGAPTDVDGAPDADADLVAVVAEDINEVQILVARVADRHRRLRSDLTQLRRVHREHLTALEAQEGSAGASRRVGNEQAALALVRRRELALQRRLADHAVAAQSGRLAQLLASMSAAIAQQLVVLPVRVDE